MLHRSSYRWRSELTTTLIRRIALLASLLALLSNVIAAPILLAADDAQTADPFDYSVDKDGDGLPDQLVAAMKQLRELRKQGADKDTIEATRAALFARLPYSAKTRATKAQIEALVKQLEHDKDDVDRQKTYQKILDLIDSATDDPNHVKTVETFARLLPDRTVVDLSAVNQSDQVTAAQNMEDTFIYPLDSATADGQTVLPQPDAESVNLPTDESDIIRSFLYLPQVSTTLLAQDEATGTQAEGELLAAGLEQVQANYFAYMPSIQKPKQVNFSNLQRGDLLFRDAKGAAFPLLTYKKYYSHDGMYENRNNTTTVFESNISDGVRLRSVNTWKETYPVAFMRSNAGSTTAALDWAEGHFGTGGTTSYFNMVYLANPYDSNSNKTYEGYGIYCSQLAWKIFNHMGVEVDSNNPDYKDYLGAVLFSQTLTNHISGNHVMPDEIYLDDSVLVYEKGLGLFGAP